MPAPIHHVDLAVADVERSLAFYLDLLGPLGWAEEIRYPTYRGTEEVVYLARPGALRDGGLGLRPADGGTHSYYNEAAGLRKWATRRSITKPGRADCERVS
jgi:catechol 2,3-dioxygenase-like lactoylglutathione lyase family enzyme